MPELLFILKLIGGAFGVGLFLLVGCFLFWAFVICNPKCK